MQCQAIITIAGLAISFVAYNRVSFFGQMHTYLMLSAGQKVDFQQTQALGLFQDLIRRMG